MAPRKRTLLDVEADKQATKFKPRRLRRYRTEEEVQKVRGTIFKDWSHEDVHVLKVHGESLWDRLLADKRAVKRGQKTIAFGSVYYKELKQKFRPGDDPVVQLEQFKSDTDEVDNALMEAMIPALKYIPDTNSISDYLRNTTREPTKTEAVGIWQWALSLSPRCSKKRWLCLEILRWAARFQARTKFPDILAVTRFWVDNVLCETYLNLRKTGVELKTFLKVNMNILELIIDSNDLQKLVDEENDYGNVKNALNSVVGGSKIGSTMWSFAVGTVLSNDVHEIVEKKLVEMEAKLINAQVVLNTKKAISNALESLPNFDLLPVRREIRLKYRNYEIPNVKISHIAQEINMKVSARVKTIAVEKQLLKPYWCEDLLPLAPTTPDPKGVEAEVVLGASVARSQVEKAIAASPGRDVDVLMDILQRQIKTFKGLDGDFDVDVAILQAICGDSGGAALKAHIVNVMPSKDVVRAPTDSLRLLTALMGQPVFKLSSREHQGKTNALIKALGLLTEGRSPDISQLKQDSWLGTIVNQFEFFVREVQRSDKTKGKNVTVFGASALKLKFNALVEKHTAGNANFGDVQFINAFGWMLEADQRKVVDSILTDLSKKPAKASSAFSSSSKPVIEKSAKKSDMQNASARAMNLFVKKR